MNEASSRANNFDALRLLAAAAVIFGHAHPLTRAPDVVLLGNSVQAVAVKIFFVVSGFLIATSWVLDPSVVRYLRKRVLRIFPGLAFLLALTIFLLGPAFTRLSIGDYFGNSGTWRYFWSNLLLNPVYALADLFPKNPYPSAVNGSLWSLPVEFLMYLVMPCVLMFSRIGRGNGLFVAFTLGLCAVSVAALRMGGMAPTQVFYGTGLASVLDVAPYFFLGSIFAITPIRRLLNPSLALFGVGLFVLFQPSTALVSEAVLYILLPICALSFGSASTPVLRRAGRFGDFSYGLYLYGFVVQQTLLGIYPGMATLTNAFLSLGISFVLAFVSWHLVESPALKLKKPRDRAIEGIQRSIA